MLEIYCWNGRFLFKGNEFTGTFHKHFPLQLIVSVEDVMTVRARDGSEAHSHAILVDSGVEHVCENHKRSVSLFVDPETAAGKALRSARVSGPMSSLPFENLDPIRNEFEAFRLEEGCGCARASAFYDRLLHAYIDEMPRAAENDERIERILALLPSVPDKKISVKTLAAGAGMSETRLMHLFKEKVGTPIRRYLLWKRLLDATFLIIDGKPFTMAAIEAGFSDYAHFSRTFKRMFGSKVENIFKNDRFVQAYNGEK